MSQLVLVLAAGSLMAGPVADAAQPFSQFGHQEFIQFGRHMMCGPELDRQFARFVPEAVATKTNPLLRPVSSSPTGAAAGEPAHGAGACMTPLTRTDFHR